MLVNVDLDLLEKTYQNANMGVIAIETVLDKANDKRFIQDLKSQLKDYEQIADMAKDQLVKHKAEVKEKSFYNKMMLKGNINVQTMMDSTDSRIADMVIKGSTMGVTQMTKLLHDKTDADGISRHIAEDFISREEKNIEVMKAYL